jgi:hypothetical protein
MARRALIIGINDCDNYNDLTGCILDANAMENILARNDDGSPNYDCRLLTTAKERVTRERLREVWEQLFDNFSEDILFYFSGHGTPTRTGGYIVTQDATEKEPGLPMDELLSLANDSKAREVLLILDCCFSGALGNPKNLREYQAQLREGVTIDLLRNCSILSVCFLPTSKISPKVSSSASPEYALPLFWKCARLSKRIFPSEDVSQNTVSKTDCC